MVKRSPYVKYKGMIVPPALRDFLAGRIWVKEYVPFSQSFIDTLIHHKYIQAIEGISEKPILQCNRCQNTDSAYFYTFQCAKCNKKCVYCRHCISMGRIASCTTLLTWSAQMPKFSNKHPLHWHGSFTASQQRAAYEIVDSVKQKRSHLLHAVCGSGKTEILFQAVHYALTQRLRVCVATPRTDVVLELLPRFQQVFPHTIIHALYGNAPKQSGHAQLVIATTHQLYRFQDAFDVMIVDEADAFPYTFDETLQHAVIKAKKQETPIIFVTATPSKKLLSRMKKEQWGYSFIPRRYHGFPLPVPRIQPLWNYKKQIEKHKIPHPLQTWTLHQLDNKQPFLIFFPTIELMEKAISLFQQLHPHILSVHSEDNLRKEKVLQLRNEEIPGLLTTTILERGITIKNVQVAVVGAESEIFNESALIQISGRVGRNMHHPTGDIVFFHHGLTNEINAAIAEICRLNKEGV